VVQVRDSGPGIPDEAMPHIFDRFFKADKARRRSEGSGLGLAIAFENARLHAGELSARNHPNGGAVFTFRMPRGITDDYDADGGPGDRIQAGSPDTVVLPVVVDEPERDEQKSAVSG